MSDDSYKGLVILLSMFLLPLGTWVMWLVFR